MFLNGATFKIELSMYVDEFDKFKSDILEYQVLINLSNQVSVDTEDSFCKIASSPKLLRQLANIFTWM